MTVMLKPDEFQTNSDGSEPSVSPNRSSHVLHERASRYYWEGTGALSIKSFFQGQALYDAGNGRFAVDESSYLVLNHGQTYSITVESETPVESFCIFFEAGFAEDVHHSLTASPSRLLDEPMPHCALPINFFERTYPHDDVLSPTLFDLKAVFARKEKGGLKERLHEIMERLLYVHGRARKEVDSLPAMRATTREELYRRLHRARDFTSASLDQPITLDDMARAACLSPNHFLRTFKQAFHQTPHQYLVSRRMERARHLLAHTDLSVTDICFAVGFESLGSFSWLFRRSEGVSPEKYRRAKR